MMAPARRYRDWGIAGIIVVATAILLLAWAYQWLGDTKYGGVATIDETISRAMNQLVKPQHFSQVQRFKQLYAHYQRNHDLISVGAYVRGSDPLLDEAIALYPRMENFLKQGIYEAESYDTSLNALTELFGSSSPMAIPGS